MSTSTSTTDERPQPPKQPDQVKHSPVVEAHLARRAANAQLRLADKITAFAGSMAFVYVSAIGFALWMILAEKKPWATLTLVVSLEAIFLSTFVMIGQNRSASFQQAKADHDFLQQETELQDNTSLTQQVLELTQQVHLLAQQIHQVTVARPAPDQARPAVGEAD
jgi:uncharacterized membrane protein